MSTKRDVFILSNVSANNLLKSLEIQNSLFCVLEYMLVILSRFSFNNAIVQIRYRRSNCFFFLFNCAWDVDGLCICINIFPYIVYHVWVPVTCIEMCVFKSMHWMGQKNVQRGIIAPYFGVKLKTRGPANRHYTTHPKLTLVQNSRPLSIHNHKNM